MKQTRELLTSTLVAGLFVVVPLLLVLFLCFLVGAAVRTPSGRAVRERMERTLFRRLPGYGLLRSLTQRLAETPMVPRGSRRWLNSRTRSYLAS